LARRSGDPLLAIDIAMPRDIDPAAGKLDGFRLLDMDDLSSFADRGLAERRAEIPAVSQIVQEELDRYEAARTSRQVAPLISDLRRWAETVREGELERYDTRLDELDADAREAVDAMTKAIVAKLTHTPTVRLKDAAGTPKGERLSAALRDLYDLP